MNQFIRNTSVILTFILFTCGHVIAQNDVAFKDLQKSWAQVNYQLQGKKQISAFESLMATADDYIAQQPKNPELLIWRGIIKSTYAGAKGGLTALKYAKASRRDFEQAMDINAQALHGSAYTSLGTLYFSVPGWPVAFGDDKKAKRFLLKALSINPQGIDANYFYAQFLQDQGDLGKSLRYYEKALAAEPRLGRAIADSGRRDDIRRAILALNQ